MPHLTKAFLRMHCYIAQNSGALNGKNLVNKPILALHCKNSFRFSIKINGIKIIRFALSYRHPTLTKCCYSDAMTELSNDLLSQWNPIHEQSDYRCAVNCLRLLSRHYDTALRHPDQARVFVSEMAIGRNRERCVALLDAAVKLVDPQSNVFYNSQTGELCFEFDASKSEKPPMRQAIYQLDTLKETIFSNSVRDTQGNYLIRQPKKLDPNILDVIFLSAITKPAITRSRNITDCQVARHLRTAMAKPISRASLSTPIRSCNSFQRILKWTALSNNNYPSPP